MYDTLSSFLNQDDGEKNGKSFVSAEIPGVDLAERPCQTHIMPLVEQGLIKLSIPEKPKSTKQLYYTAEK